jgi:hypothetical protein
MEMSDDKRATLPEVAELHGAIARTLKQDIDDPERRTPALLAVAVKFVKDQGVTAAPSRSADIKKLLESLPYLDEDEEAEVRP